MDNDNFNINYDHFADIVSVSVGRLLANEREKGVTYSYETFCTILEHQIGSHFGINPEEYFKADDMESNCKYFSMDVVGLFTEFKNKNGKKPNKDECKKFYEDILTIMNKYHIAIIGVEEYGDRWLKNEEEQLKTR